MMSEPAFQNYHVAPQHDGWALIAILRQVRPGESWSQARRLIHNRHVQINGNLSTDEGRKLKAGDVIKVWKEPRAAPSRPDDVRIRYLDAHVVVVEKPAGVTTLRHSEEQHWSKERRQLQPTLDEMLRQILAKKTAGSGRRTPGRRPKPPALRAVHRLDRDTSGLMVFARSAEAERRLVHMFRKHDLHRAYQAIAHGEVREQTFESDLVRDRGDGLRGSTSLPDVGKHAVTHVRPIEFLNGYTLVECRLETGRTHQIRIHLAEAGHMVCGEKVYNHRLFGEMMEDRSGAQRQALHAAELGFKHPITGEDLMFQMPMPADMQRLLDRLRGKK
ncbi:MAG: RluA family pseudouridine synthase [Thermoguttaceae bacterium]